MIIEDGLRIFWVEKTILSNLHVNIGLNLDVSGVFQTLNAAYGGALPPSRAAPIA